MCNITPSTVQQIYILMASLVFPWHFWRLSWWWWWWSSSRASCPLSFRLNFKLSNVGLMFYTKSSFFKFSTVWWVVHKSTLTWLHLSEWVTSVRSVRKQFSHLLMISEKTLSKHFASLLFWVSLSARSAFKQFLMHQIFPCLIVFSTFEEMSLMVRSMVVVPPSNYSLPVGAVEPCGGGGTAPDSVHARNSQNQQVSRNGSGNFDGDVFCQRQQRLLLLANAAGRGNPRLCWCSVCWVSAAREADAFASLFRERKAEFCQIW